MKESLKKNINIIGLSFGKAIERLLYIKPFYTVYNFVYERLPHFCVKALVRFVSLPPINSTWDIRLVNGKTVCVDISPRDLKSTQFALSYKWHSPALNFTEFLLHKYADISCPWIDIGANLGIRSLLPLSEGRFVYMIEPNQELNKANKKRCENNKFHAYKILEVGISDRTGIAKFYIDETSYNSSLNESVAIHNKISKVETIILDTIDNLFSQLPCPPACIKIDVEGHELAVLDGGIHVIEKWHPPIIIEVNTSSNNFSEFKVRVERLGYKIYQIKEYGLGKYYQMIDGNMEAVSIVSNDFLVVHDKTLEAIIQKYTI